MQWESLYTLAKRHVERQDTAKLLYSLKFPTRALVDSDGEPLHKYDYYVRLRVDKPWKVPLLYGQLPRAPDSAATANERGTYGLLMMLLFRPFRHPRSFRKPCPTSIHGNASRATARARFRSRKR